MHLRQMLSRMHDKNFTKAFQAAACLGLLPIQSLNPFSKVVYSLNNLEDCKKLTIVD